MTTFEIKELDLGRQLVGLGQDPDPRLRNWPVVYTIDDAAQIYVGESLNVRGRLRQHFDSGARRHLRAARVVIDSTFNKSVCLDLESYLIRLFAGEGRYQVLNRNEGITNADYYRRAEYQRTFDAIFEALRERGLFSRPVREIENSDLFKLSPFKALTPDQSIAIDDILSGLFQDLETRAPSRIVIKGDPGTGKTVVGIYLTKLLTDIKHADTSEPVDGDSLLSEFFVEGYPELLQGFEVGLVVPQQSLRASIKKVFDKTPGLHRSMVLTPFQVGQSAHRFDLLIVDEAHRLNQRAAQASGVQNRQFVEINESLFGADDPDLTQLDWIEVRSQHQIYLLDEAQAVRPADIGRQAVRALTRSAISSGRHYPLTTQMRVRGAADYVGYVRRVLSPEPPTPQSFPGYDLRFFDDVSELVAAIRARDSEVGLSRLLAGYAWPWPSKADRAAFDIGIGDVRLRWNGVAVDWVSSPGSVEEVGSIHTIQGYDLNYAGVIIGNDLRYDTSEQRLVFDRTSYFDRRGQQNNASRGITYSDDDILVFVRNIYGVLLTRGMSGTYVYVCDPSLRERLRPYFASEHR